MLQLLILLIFVSKGKFSSVTMLLSFVRSGLKYDAFFFSCLMNLFFVSRVDVDT